MAYPMTSCPGHVGLLWALALALCGCNRDNATGLANLPDTGLAGAAWPADLAPPRDLAPTGDLALLPDLRPPVDLRDPANCLELPATYDFGPVAVGRSTGAALLAVRNLCPFAIRVKDVTAGGPNPNEFALVIDVPLPIGAGLQAPIPVAFQPLSRGVRRCTLTVFSYGQGVASVSLTGTGI